MHAYNPPLIWVIIDLAKVFVLANFAKSKFDCTVRTPHAGKPELHYPDWKRNAFRYFVSLPVIALCLLVVAISVFLILELQQWWDGVIAARGYFEFLSFGPKILLAVAIPVLDSAYSVVALWLNDKGNVVKRHLTDSCTTTF